MKQYRTFYNEVLKGDSSGDRIEAGDRLKLILNDRSMTHVTVASVQERGRRIGWNIPAFLIAAAKTSVQNATTAASDDTTGDALANALKADYNKAQADIAAIFAANLSFGAPTSSQNATTAATNDATRLALANALKANYNQAQVDVAEAFAANPVAGAPTSAQVTTVNGSNDATTQTLLNVLKAAYNQLQADISTLYTFANSGEYVPKGDEVNGVDGTHQKDRAGPGIHTIPDTDPSDLDPVINDD